MASEVAATNPDATLPSFFMPIADTGVSPHLDAAADPMWSWLGSFGLTPSDSARHHLARTAPALLAARFYPTAGPELLTTAAQFCAFGFLVDDEFDEGNHGRGTDICQTAIDGMVNALASGIGETPLELALIDLWNKFRRGRSAAWQRQFSHDVKGWLTSYLWATQDREIGNLRGVEQYLAYRQLAVGMYMFLDVAEIVAAADLPDSIRYTPALLQMRRAVAEHVAVLNDIFSADKERNHEFRYNAVLVIEDVQQCGRENAVDRANAIVTGTVHSFLDARNRITNELADADPSTVSATLRYADAMAAVLYGNYAWHRATERYTHPVELDPGRPSYLTGLFDANGKRK